MAARHAGRVTIPGTFKSRPGRPVELALPDAVTRLKSASVGLRRFALGECNILVAQEPLGPHGALLWHLSISHPSRYPTWDEIKTARYELTPHDVTMAMILPPPAEYVNVVAQDNVFHLHEIEAEYVA
jgi:hypothetical protein